MYTLANYLFCPFTLGWIGVTLAVGCLWMRRRKSVEKRPTAWKLVLLTASWGMFIAICTPVVGSALLWPLERGYPRLTQRGPDSGAIVVLGGFVYPPSEMGVFDANGVKRPSTAVLGSDSHRRCAHAIDLYRSGLPCLVVVSGGRVEVADPTGAAAGPTIARVMREYLVQGGVPPQQIVVEEKSATTYENAVQTAKILKKHGIQRVTLVTDAAHMRRAEGCFRAVGIEVAPAPCAHGAVETRWTVYSFLPSVEGAQTVERASHEWIGMVWYRVRGRL